MKTIKIDDGEFTYDEQILKRIPPLYTQRRLE